MKVLMTPDSFKGSATAAQVAAALAQGWREVRPDDEVRTCPMGDGGEGTLDALAAASEAALRVPVQVTGPDDDVIDAEFLLLSDGTAVVELATTSGLGLTDRGRPLHTHTRGFGQAIAAALDQGASRLLLAIGGSGSTDGGVGVLRELGACFYDASGADLGDGGGALTSLHHLDLGGLRRPPVGGVRVLSDVTSPLLGPAGAARMFGPQKGADTAQVDELERGLGRLASCLRIDPDAPGAGAAGGTGYALLAWGAQMASGAAAVGDAVGLSDRIADSDVVVTGEGRFDGQSSYGKVPWHVVQLARTLGRPVALVAGLIEAPTDEFSTSAALVELAGSAEASMADPLRYCVLAGRELARRQSAGS